MHSFVLIVRMFVGSLPYVLILADVALGVCLYLNTFRAVVFIQVVH